MRYLLLLVLFLPSCTLYENLKASSEKIDKGLEKLQAKYDQVKAEADTDGDGVLSLQELLAYGGAAGWVLWRNMRSDKRKAEIETDVKILKTKLPTT